MPSRLNALPGQIILLCDGARSLLRKALEEGSVEKMRDLIYEIDDYLKIMASEADAAVLNANEEDSDNAHRP